MSDASVIRKERTELFVGLFIIVGLCVMGILIWQFGKFSDKLQSSYPLTLQLPDASGIAPDSSVLFSGEKIGFVDSKKLLADLKGVELELRIFDTYKNRLPDGIQVKVGTSGLMGEKYITIIPPDQLTGETVQPGETIYGHTADPMSELPVQAQRIMDKLEILLTEFNLTMRDVRDIANNFNQASEKINDQLLHEDNMMHLASTIERLSTTTSNLSQASAKLAPLIEESQNTVQAAGVPFEKLTGIIDSLQPATVALEDALSDTQATLKDMQITLDSVNQGGGVIEALLTDHQLRDDLSETLANFKNYSSSLDRHGILGYKRGKAKEGSSPPLGNAAPASRLSAAAPRAPLFRSRSAETSAPMSASAKPPSRTGQSSGSSRPPDSPSGIRGLFQRSADSQSSRPKGKPFGKR